MVEIVGNLFELEGLSKVVKEFWTIFFLLSSFSAARHLLPNLHDNQVPLLLWLAQSGGDPLQPVWGRRRRLRDQRPPRSALSRRPRDGR